jgi:hypothetical protein
MLHELRRRFVFILDKHITVFLFDVFDFRKRLTPDHAWHMDVSILVIGLNHTDRQETSKGLVSTAH